MGGGGRNITVTYNFDISIIYKRPSAHEVDNHDNRMYEIGTVSQP